MTLMKFVFVYILFIQKNKKNDLWLNSKFVLFNKVVNDFV